MKASNLKIKVTENEQTKVALCLPLASLDWIETLMPDTALNKIKERGINLKEIAEKAKASGYEPQELFSLKDIQKNYLVWIE